MTVQTQQEIRSKLHRALLAMASVDSDRATENNARGFGKIDGIVGHSLAERDPESWTARQTMAAYRVLRRYKNTQLPLFGIDFNEIDVPEEPVVADARDAMNVAVPRNPVGHATVAPTRIIPPTRMTVLDNRVAFAFSFEDPFFTAKKEAIRAMPGRQWDALQKVWTVPVTITTVETIAAFIAKYADSPAPILIDDDDAEKLDALVDALTASIRDSYAESTDYEVDGLAEGMTLYPFQQAGVKFINKHKRVILADEMGLGKTPQSIAAVVDNAAWPALVICPASLKLNWKAEFERWVGREIGLNFPRDPEASRLKIQVAQGKQPAIAEPIDVLIINYDILEAWADALATVGWEAIIADESHKLKNHKAKRTKAAATLIKKVNPELVVFASGTPFLSRPIEGWTLINMLGKGSAFGGWNNYTYRYCARVDGAFGIDVSGASNTEELNQLLRSTGTMVRRRKADVLKELPSRTWATVPVEMSAAGARKYEAAEADMAGYMAAEKAADAERVDAWRREYEQKVHESYWLDTIAPTWPEYLAKRTSDYRKSEEARLAQSEQLIRFEGLKQIAYDGKRDAVHDWIDTFLESDEKLIIFAHHRSVVEELAKKYNAPTIMGGQKVEDIEAGKQRFQNDPECKVIVCNITAGGVGHTLTAASNVAFVEMGWTPADMDQALDRAHRIGQEKPVTGWILAATLPGGGPTIDTEVAAIIAKKRAVVESATDGSGVEAQVSTLAELRERIAGHRRGR